MTALGPCGLGVEGKEVRVLQLVVDVGVVVILAHHVILVSAQQWYMAARRFIMLNGSKLTVLNMSKRWRSSLVRVPRVEAATYKRQNKANCERSLWLGFRSAFLPFLHPSA